MIGSSQQIQIMWSNQGGWCVRCMWLIWGRRVMCTGFWWRNLKEREY